MPAEQAYTSEVESFGRRKANTASDTASGLVSTVDGVDAASGMGAATDAMIAVRRRAYTPPQGQ